MSSGSARKNLLTYFFSHSHSVPNFDVVRALFFFSDALAPKHPYPMGLNQLESVYEAIDAKRASTDHGAGEEKVEKTCPSTPTFFEDEEDEIAVVDVL